MTQAAVDLTETYRRTLLEYLVFQGGETALLHAFELGRQALAAGMSVLELTTMHNSVMLSSVLNALLQDDAKQLSTRGYDFLAQCLAPYEMTRGYVEANARLRSLNEVLERRVAERTQELQESEARFRRLAENAPDVIYRYHLQPPRGFTYVSPAVTRILGYTPQAFYADPDLILNLVHEEDRHIVARVLDGQFESFITPMTVRLQHATGDIIWLEMRHVPVFDEAGALVAFEGVSRDVTEQKQAGQQLAQLLEREQTARAEAEAAVLLRETFLSVAAHELKTPVTSLRGFAQLLIRQLDQGGSLDPVLVQRTLHAFTRQSERLSRLVSQLLDVSRIETGKLTLERSLSDFTRLTEGVVAAAQVNTQHHILALLAPSPVWAMVDPLRIEQMVANLVDNAIKYSPSGGAITIEVHRHTVAEVRLSVRDHGIGIPPERRRWIFDRFYQAHTGQHLSGMGLGLYISRQIVELHGGRIEVEHPPDGGTCFIVTLPADLGDAVTEGTA